MCVLSTLTDENATFQQAIIIVQYKNEKVLLLVEQ